MKGQITKKSSLKLDELKSVSGTAINSTLAMVKNGTRRPKKIEQADESLISCNDSIEQAATKIAEIELKNNKHAIPGLSSEETQSIYRKKAAFFLIHNIHGEAATELCHLIQSTPIDLVGAETIYRDKVNNAGISRITDHIIEEKIAEVTTFKQKKEKLNGTLEFYIKFMAQNEHDTLRDYNEFTEQHKPVKQKPVLPDRTTYLQKVEQRKASLQTIPNGQIPPPVPQEKTYLKIVEERKKVSLQEQPNGQKPPIPENTNTTESKPHATRKRRLKKKSNFVEKEQNRMESQSAITIYL